MPDEKNDDQKRSGSSDGQNQAESDVSNRDSAERREGRLKADLFPGSDATFRILEVLHRRAGTGRGRHCKMYIPRCFITYADFFKGKMIVI